MSRALLLFIYTTAVVFARLYGDRTAILIEPCISGIRKEWPLKKKREKTQRARTLIKIARSAYRVSTCRLYAGRPYIRRFSKFTTSVRLFLSSRLIKPRAREWSAYYARSSARKKREETHREKERWPSPQLCKVKGLADSLKASPFP